MQKEQKTLIYICYCSKSIDQIQLVLIVLINKMFKKMINFLKRKLFLIFIFNFYEMEEQLLYLHINPNILMDNEEVS